MLKPLTLTLFLFSMTACVTYPVPRYAVSVQNVTNMKKELSDSYSVEVLKMDQKKFVKATNHPNEKSRPQLASNERQCRALQIHIPDGRSFETYVGDALKNELLLAEKYSPDSKNPIQLKFEKLDFSSHSATWVIDSTVTIGTKKREINLKEKFETSYGADNACRDLAVNFQNVVELYIAKVIDFLKDSENKK